MRNHGGDIIDEESWRIRRNHGGDIIDEESWRGHLEEAPLGVFFCRMCMHLINI